jgi:hypothetical protein
MRAVAYSSMLAADDGSQIEGENKMNRVKQIATAVIALAMFLPQLQESAKAAITTPTGPNSAKTARISDKVTPIFTAVSPVPPGDFVPADQLWRSIGTESVQRPVTVGGSYGTCMVDAMLNGPSGERAFKIWMGTWSNICNAIYG